MALYGAYSPSKIYYPNDIKEVVEYAQVGFGPCGQAQAVILRARTCVNPIFFPGSRYPSCP